MTELAAKTITADKRIGIQSDIMGTIHTSRKVLPVLYRVHSLNRGNRTGSLSLKQRADLIVDIAFLWSI
jgi:hypothetical protein